MKYKVNFFLNDEPMELYVDANKTMLNVLRDELCYTGTKEGCGAGECGACTVIVDGLPLNACLVLAPEMDGMHITTVEGLAKDGELSPVQKVCTPGFVMSATALLMENPQPTREEIVRAISGNLCRCTGYVRIIEAIEDVAAQYAKQGGAN